MFETDELERPLVEAAIAVDRTGIHPRWERTLGPILAEANLRLPPNEWMQTGGRARRHSEHLGHILADLQFLQRAYPDARW
jgi:ring-1,2-phenylacetyl-CoA epoxidase subunit PaaC